MLQRIFWIDIESFSSTCRLGARSALERSQEEQLDTQRVTISVQLLNKTSHLTYTQLSIYGIYIYAPEGQTLELYSLRRQRVFPLFWPIQSISSKAATITTHTPVTETSLHFSAFLCISLHYFSHQSSNWVFYYMCLLFAVLVLYFTISFLSLCRRRVSVYFIFLTRYYIRSSLIIVRL